MSDVEIEEGRQRHAAAGLFFSLFILALAIVAVVAFARWQSRGVTVHATFKDARGLKGGEKVVLSGVPIGEVTGVKLLREDEIVVTLRIDDPYADKVKQGFTALIASATFPNVSGERQVELFNPADPQAGPVNEGDTAEGQESIIGVKAWQVKEKLSTVGDNAAGAARGLADKLAVMAEELKDIPESPEVKAAMERISQMAEALKERGQDGMDKLQTHWEEMKKEVGPVMEQWKTRGKDKAVNAWQGAVDLWRDKSQLLREYYESWRETRTGGTVEGSPTPAPAEKAPASAP